MTLESLRNTLLPKLMSGEVRVSGIDDKHHECETTKQLVSLGGSAPYLATIPRRQTT